MTPNPGPPIPGALWFRILQGRRHREHPIFFLQRTIGNRAVLHWLAQRNPPAPVDGSAPQGSIRFAAPVPRRIAAGLASGTFVCAGMMVLLPAAGWRLSTVAGAAFAGFTATILAQLTPPSLKSAPSKNP